MPKGIVLKRGQEFLTRGDPSILVNGINVAQKFWASDNESFYNHAGIIVSDKGDTFEALWKLDHYNLDQRIGDEVLIVERLDLTPEMIEKGIKAVEKYDGVRYPILRLPLHLLHLAKFIHWKYPVCSELTAKYEYEMGVRQQWWGIMPDNLADEGKISRYYKII
ncbi:MAG: hypothetical protein PHI16_06390, partial [Methanocellales archaeon]|nr:hypothetical protein [Methanocellales archaeon]